MIKYKQSIVMFPLAITHRCVLDLNMDTDRRLNEKDMV